MDVFADLLGGARARGGLFHQVVLTPPWAVRVQDGAPLALASMVRGDAWLLPDHGDPLRLRQGDMAVMRGPDAYALADDPATPPDLVINPGDCATAPDGTDLCEQLELGVRTWGREADGPQLLVNGTYPQPGDLSRRLLAALPPVLVLREPDWDCGLMPLVAAEIAREDPGQQVVLDRLLDLLLISVLRAWFARPDAEPPAWYRAQGDPVVGQALRLLHEHPGHAWTVASLAAKCGVSRAGLARRFTELVGETPMAYLTGWRLDLAAQLLSGTDTPLAGIAARVGYADAFALSTAFKRVRGVSPAAHRAAARDAQPD